MLKFYGLKLPDRDPQHILIATIRALGYEHTCEVYGETPLDDNSVLHI